MTAEFGIFNAEGLIEGGFHHFAGAKQFAADLKAEGDNEAYAAQVCVSHPEQPHDTCDGPGCGEESDDDDD